MKIVQGAADEIDGASFFFRVGDVILVDQKSLTGKLVCKLLDGREVLDPIDRLTSLQEQLHCQHRLRILQCADKLMAYLEDLQMIDSHKLHAILVNRCLLRRSGELEVGGELEE